MEQYPAQLEALFMSVWGMYWATELLKTSVNWRGVIPVSRIGKQFHEQPLGTRSKGTRTYYVNKSHHDRGREGINNGKQHFSVDRFHSSFSQDVAMSIVVTKCSFPSHVAVWVSLEEFELFSYTNRFLFFYKFTSLLKTSWCKIGCF